MTLDRVVLNLGSKEFANGLTYTGVTRVRRLEDMVFRPFPSLNRFCSVTLNYYLFDRYICTFVG